MLTAQGVFFAVLLINTVFSVRFFMPLIPRHKVQYTVDALLVCTYLVLAFSLGRPLLFPFCATLLFIFASAKYTLALGEVKLEILKKKIIIDLLGVLLCISTLGVALAGYPAQAASMLAGVFCAANIYLLLINPMYAHPKED